ncbi:MAG: phage tail tape measure protein [Rhizobiaceae bacterium]
MAIIEKQCNVTLTSNTDQVKKNNKEIEKDLSELDKLAKSFGNSFTASLKQSIAEGRSFQDTLKAIGLQLSSTALQAALQPLQNSVGSSFGNILNGFLAPSTTGQGQAGLTRMARGGVVASPTFFATPGGGGLMGEAGPEAVLPLARGSDGRLGVQATSSGGSGSAAAAPANITFNVSTPDVQGFRRSQAQISTMLTRTVNRGRRHL